MSVTDLPKFVTEKRSIPARSKPKIVAKKAKRGAIRVEGDTGTAEMKRQQKVVLEVRDRSSTGHPTSAGARVECQIPLDRYKTRQELDPDNAWRNLMLWEAAERLRRDFEASGMAPKVCGSFQPRVTGGRGGLDADHQVDAWKRYKKAMDAVPQTLMPSVFWVCIAGEAASEWARRNAKIPQAGLAILQLALAELAHHYGLCKLPAAVPEVRAHAGG